MFVLVTRGSGDTVGLSLEEPDDCTHLHLEGRGVGLGEIAAALAHAEAGEVDGGPDAGRHALLEPAALQRMATDRMGEGWDDRFRAMVDYADAKGWVASDGRLQAHVELT